MRRLLSLTNIPTPYRLHFYSELQRQCAEALIELQVSFMAMTEPGRHWAFDRSQWPPTWRVHRGVHPAFRGKSFHLNPSVIADLLREAPDWLLVSGSWFMPTVQAAIRVAQRSRTKLIFWNESNLAYVEKRGGVTGDWRRATFNRFDAFAVPGQWAEDYVRHYSDFIASRPIIRLPNVVAEEKFRDKVMQRRVNLNALRHSWAVRDDKPVILIVARLEPIKGIAQFLESALCAEVGDRFTLLIAGTGSLEGELRQKIADTRADANVRLLGHCSEDQVLDLLSLADVFVLPSIGDPYPLSVIEAAFSGLPLLLSDRVGCHPEALIPGENGHLFDPYVPASIQQSLNQFLSLSDEERKTMGARSLQLAESRFGTRIVVRRFVEALVGL